MRSGFSAGKSTQNPSSGGGADPNSEPTFDAATDTMHYVGGAADSARYTSQANWGANTNTSDTYWVPHPSNRLGEASGEAGGIVSSECTLETGLAGGPAMGIHYNSIANEDPKVILVNCPIGAGRLVVWKVWAKITGAFAKDTELAMKGWAIMSSPSGNSGRCQWAFHSAFPARDDIDPNIHHGYGTVWTPNGMTGAENSLNGIQQKTAGVNYPYDLKEAGAWNEYTMAMQSHNPDNVTKDGLMRQWIDHDKVVDLSRLGYQTLVPGSAYPWCQQSHQEASFLHNTSVPTAESFFIGRDTSNLTTTFTLLVDINSMRIFSRPRIAA